MDSLPTDWRMALQATAAARRVMVLGASDMGKSHFVRQALAGDGERALVDLDPGQKMIGAPGTLGLGMLRGDGSVSLDRCLFTGSTNPIPLGEFLAATRNLLQGQRQRVIVNTSGFVRGAGTRLQQLTIESVRPELIVAIVDGAELDPILRSLSGVTVNLIQRAPGARGKGPGERRRARQQAFAVALEGAARQTIPADVIFRPTPPAPFVSRARPVCAVLGANGRPICIGVVEDFDAEGVTIFASKRCPRIAEIQLGRMWATPAGPAWRLLERLQPSW